MSKHIDSGLASGKTTTPEAETILPTIAPEEEAQPPEPKPPGGKVKVSSLAPLAPFRFKGHLYTRRRFSVAGVKCLSKSGKELVFLDPDTMVESV